MNAYNPLPFFLNGELTVEPAPRYKRGVWFAGAALFFIFSATVFLFSLPPRNAAAQNQAIMPAAAPVVEAASGGKSSLELHIANNGLVLLRAAKVVSVNGPTLTLATSWGSSTFLWTVHTAASRSGEHVYGTQFLNIQGEAVAPGNISTGDLVTVTGLLDTNAKEPTLEADTVRSLQ